jgi:hypothetical protein
MSDADAAPLGDVIIQIGLRDSDGPCDPGSYKVSAPDGLANRLSADAQFVGDFLDG